MSCRSCHAATGSRVPERRRKPPAKRAGAAREGGGRHEAALPAPSARPPPSAEPRRQRRRRPSSAKAAVRANATSSTTRSTSTAGAAPAGPQTKLTEDQRVLLGDLFAVVEEHAGDAAEEVDRDLVEQAFVFACERHADQRRASGEDFIVHPVGVAKICAGMRLDTATLCAALLHDTVEDTSASLDEVEDEFGEEVGALVDGVTKLSGRHLPEPRRPPGRELPQDDGRDGPGHPGHPDQARRPAAQHAHDRLDAEAQAAGEGEGDARDLRPARAPARHPRDQVGARGPRLRDAPPAQVQRDQAARLPAARRARGLRVARRPVPGEGAGGGRHRGRDLRARQALLLDLLEDDEEGPRVQRDLRPHRDARARRLGEGLLRRDRGHPLALEAAARALQGLGRDAQVQHVPGPPHHGDRARGPAARDPDPHPRDAPHRRVRRRRALDLQGGRRQARRAEGRVAAPPARLAAGDQGPAGVRRDAQGRPVRGRGVRLHPEGRGQVARRGRHAARLRLLDPHRRRPPLRGRQGQRQDRAAPLRAPVGRHLRGADLEEGARPVARLARAGQDHARPVEDPRLVHARAPRGLRAHRPRDPAREPEARRAAAPEDGRLAAARGRDPRDGLQEGRGLLHRARPVEDLAEDGHQQADAPPQGGRGGGGRRRRRPSCSSAARRPRRPPPRRPTGSRSRAWTT